MDFYEGGEALYNPLIKEKLENLKYHFSKRPSLVLIDEISMVSNTMLMKLHARLCEITGRYNISNLKFKLFIA